MITNKSQFHHFLLIENKAKYSLVYMTNSESLDLRKSKGIPNISMLYCELLHTVQMSNVPLKELHSSNC